MRSDGHAFVGEEEDRGPAGARTERLGAVTHTYKVAHATKAQHDHVLPHGSCEEGGQLLSAAAGGSEDCTQAPAKLG